MIRAEIVEIINKFLVEEFEIDISEIKPTYSLKETMDLDSLDYVDLVVEIEDNFGIKVKAEDFTKLNTFDDFYSYIENELNQTITNI